MKAAFGVENNFRIAVYSARERALDRELIARHESHNLVHLAGRNVIRDLLGRGVPGTGTGYAPQYIGLGTDGTDVNDGDDGLITEVFRNQMTHRQALSSAMVYRLFLADSEGNGYTYQEAGLYDNPIIGQGNNLARVTFPPVQKTVAVQLLISWTMTIVAITS